MSGANITASVEMNYMEAQELQDVGSDKSIDDAESPMEASHEDSHESEGKEDHGDPTGVKARLKRQERFHQREMRDMRAQLENMHSRMNSNPQMDQSRNDNNSEPGSVDELVHRAVSHALNHRDMEERKAKEAQHQAYIDKQHQELKRHLDHVSDKYDDFEEVTGGDAPFTNHMVSAALMLPKKGAGSAGEVIYKLGKNPAELERISKLHPLDQASEMVKLSHALMGGEDNKSSSPRPLGQIKNTPVNNSHHITDKTSISELRQRMKSNWK